MNSLLFSVEFWDGARGLLTPTYRFFLLFISALVLIYGSTTVSLKSLVCITFTNYGRHLSLLLICALLYFRWLGWVVGKVLYGSDVWSINT